MSERVLRLFVSSPSDVAAERERVRVVADRLNGEFEGLARIQVNRWEDAFYTATASFQEAIDSALGGMTSTDIVICVVWKRAGLRLNPAIWHRPDGSAYESGTVLEFESAVAASRAQPGTPDVYLFRKTEPVRFDEHAVEEQKEQRALLQIVLKRWTETPEGYNTAGSQPFDNTDDFEAKLEACLRHWLERKGVILKGPSWDRKLKGSPFRGLAAFDTPHAPVFFGRDAAIDRATSRLRGTSFLLVLGVSGTGKSSLLRAGVMPRLVRPGVIPGIDLWRTAIVLPTADPLASLAQALFADGALAPELRAGDFSTPHALTEALVAGGEVALAPIRSALTRAARERAAKLVYDAPRPAKLLLAVDQVERLFIEAEPARVDAFATVLRTMVEAGLATVIAALRSDAYGRFQQVAPFLALREAGGTLDLLPPGITALEEMVTRPVAACHPPLAFETAGRNSLADTLVKDARGGDALPLLQMTLQRLYEAEAARGDGVLRFADYPGMDAAVSATAGEAFAALDEAARGELPALLTAIVRNVGIAEEGGEAALTILPVMRESFERGRPARTALIDAFITHRLLTADENDDGLVSVRPVHEALLRAWPEAVRIVGEHAALIRVRHTLEPMAADWAHAPAGSKADYLVTSPALLAGAAQLPARFGEDLGEMREYIAASLAADARRRDAERRHQRRILGATAAGLVGALVLAGFAGLQWRKADLAEKAAVSSERLATEQKEIAERERAIAEQQKIFAEQQKTLAEQQKEIAEQQRAFAEQQRVIAENQKAIAEQQRERAAKTLTAATRAADSLVSELIRKFRDRTGMPIDLVRTILEQALALERQLADTGETPPDLKASQATTLRELVVTLLALGETKAALAAAEQALTIQKGLVADDPTNVRWHQNLPGVYDDLGDVLAKIGRYEHALDAFREGLSIREKYAATAPDDAYWQRGLLISFERIGDVLVLQGKRPEALGYFRKHAAIGEKLLSAAPNDPVRQRTLSVSYDRIGDALFEEQKYTETLELYRKSFDIRVKLAAANPNDTQRQRDLSISHEKMGGTLRALKKNEEALESYRSSLRIRETLANADPRNAGWQRDLSFAHEKIGEVLEGEGKRGEAIEVYRRALAIREKLARADPGNAQAQRDVSFSYTRIGDLLNADGKRAEALDAYRRTLAIREKLVASDPGNGRWQYDLFTSLWRVAEAGDQPRARFTRALEILRKLSADGILSEGEKVWIERVEQKIAALPPNAT